ncbi:DUF99 family protein [Pleionea sp. CnH1-48]|uniref:endonuclease dU n=1 Tax=Pleionea sp. CnH1-48 TaxID=2954494 RepID=UPI00209828BC|nr:DUF99 family protein [Pleionea sp. CnH1-48]MCO7227368.1 DUF99 family protein [Pleionea sp. CnH1-48]
MKSLKNCLRLNKKIRVIGFDDSPFDKHQSTTVNVSGIVCSNTRFEGMLWNKLTKDGMDATSVIASTVKESKFYDQLHLVLIDGVTVGGFNPIDLPLLANTLNIPCIAVMRKEPNLDAIANALKHFPNTEERLETILKAGEIYTPEPFVYQCAGCTSDEAHQALIKLTDNGNVPEALRLAHLIGSAVMTGQSSNRA